MIRGGKQNDSKIIRSWFGQRLLLSCDVIHHNYTRPVFEWYRKSFTKQKGETLFAPNNTKTLIIEKVNATDFGEYTCRASTNIVTVKQKLIVSKLGKEFV